jgi:hypothetical protein
MMRTTFCKASHAHPLIIFALILAFLFLVVSPAVYANEILIAQAQAPWPPGPTPPPKGQLAQPPSQPVAPPPAPAAQPQAGPPGVRTPAPSPPSQLQSQIPPNLPARPPAPVTQGLSAQSMPSSPAFTLSPDKAVFNFDDADIYSVIQVIFGEALKVNYV